MAFTATTKEAAFKKKRMENAKNVAETFSFLGELSN